jgi:hypothetical protein
VKLLLLCALGLVATSAHAGGRALAWDTAFAVDGAPAKLHLRADYRDARGAHTLELWRDGAELRRDTDGQLSLFVAHGGDDDRFHVVDRRRGVEYQVRRTNLYRIGSFPTWTGMVSLLTRPAGTTTVRATGDSARTSVGECRWFDAGRRQRVCWSDAYRLPLIISERGKDGRSRRVLEVRAIGSDFDRAVLAPPTSGLMVINVDRDVSPTSD